ncbi:hypothetical protein [Streptomyces sp. NPDC059564]|uniref:hypothetical protein n=1 Tax=Streptomyces sp. NPDC059564 TaxID=3346865 RepID=UPI0036B496B8
MPEPDRERAGISTQGNLIKSDLPERERPSEGHRNSNPVGNDTEKNLIESESPERENAKAKDLESKRD